MIQFQCQDRTVHFDRPVVMGILNATPDSFYDGGRYNQPDALLAHAHQLLADGADILDLGVQSSRPGAALSDPEEEATRLSTLVALLRHELPDTPISVDTYYSLPAQRAIEAGADIVNDISGGQFDPQMLPTVAQLKVPYILTHTRGVPATMMQPQNTHYNDLVDDLTTYFEERLNLLNRLGSGPVWLDPGFGFAKTAAQCHQLLHRLPQLMARFEGIPFVVALSNKSMITHVMAADPLLSVAQTRPTAPMPATDPTLPVGIGLQSLTAKAQLSEMGTLVLNTLALFYGAAVLRVHTPLPSRLAITLLSQR